MSSVKALSGSRVIATDGMIGRLVDLMFDEKWAVRYLVVDAGDWLARSQVLISPHSVRFIDTRSRLIVAGLTRNQVAGSPPLDARLHITRQQEWDYCAYFGYSAYWPCDTYRSPDTIVGVNADRRRRPFGRTEDAAGSSIRTAADPGLRSCRAMSGFLARGDSEELGRVDDLLFDEGTWIIRHIVISAGRWLDRRRFEVAPERLRSVSWNERCLIFGVKRADFRRDHDEYKRNGSLRE